ncbi:MAG: ATP-binding protein, partial [Actinomycetota bacterium]
DALFSSADVSFLVILNRKGQVLDAAGLPDVDALGIAGSVSAQSVLASGNPVATLDVAGPSRLAYLGFTPAIDPRVPDRLAGVVVVGRFLDSTYLSAVSNATGFQASLLRGGEVSGSTLASGRQRYLNDPDVRSLLESAAEDGRQVTAHTGGAGGLISAYIPLLQGQGSSQRTLGFLTLSTGASVVGTAAAEVVRALFLVSAAAALVAAALAAAGGRRIARPVRALTGAAERVRGGDLLARASVSGEDEVATLARAFNDMASSVEGLTHSLRDAAATDARLRARLEAVLFGMGDALAVTDGDGVVQVFNRAAETLTGSSAVQAIGRPLGEAVRGPEGHGHSLAAAAGSPLARGTRTFRGAILRAGGDVVEVAVSAAPVPGPGGEILGRVVVMRDVTREVEVERMKSEFLSNISHELRTPLTPIKGYAELLRRKDFPRKRQEVFLDNMIEAANKLERIVQILVDFSAFEAGRLEVKREPVPVRLLLDDTVARWRERIQTHTIVRRARADLPAVAGDPRMLERVLDELVDNAVKFSPDGGTITLSAEAVKWRTGSGRAHRGVRLSVRDHGVGISPDHLPRLFEEFRQADGSETREFGGLGLGLAFVRRIGDALGGNIEVESTPGKGSVFHFTLPEAVLRGRSARGEAT